MRTRDTDLIIKMVDFTKPGVGTKQFMDEQSFIDNVMNSEYTMRRLENGMLKCLLTHQGRDYADADKTGTPYDDLLATHPDLCGIIRDIWIENHIAYAAVDLLDPVAFPAAGKVRDLIKKGSYVGVSMATDSDVGPNGNFFIRELIGCDFTLDNFFIGSGIVSIKKNFSNGKGSHHINFSSFGREDAIIEKDNLINFSLRDVLREAKKPYYMVLASRIRETIRCLKSMNTDEIYINREFILSYVNDMIYNWISKAMNGPGKINVNLGLRINQFMKNPRIVTDFNQKINIVKNTYRSQGYMTKIVQEKMNACMSDLINGVWEYICDKSDIEMASLTSPVSKSSTMVNNNR
jgi:hypothetical protein